MELEHTKTHFVFLLCTNVFRTDFNFTVLKVLGRVREFRALTQIRIHFHHILWRVVPFVGPHSDSYEYIRTPNATLLRISGKQTKSRKVSNNSSISFSGHSHCAADKPIYKIIRAVLRIMLRTYKGLRGHVMFCEWRPDI